jgi:hypothetical protein
MLTLIFGLILLVLGTLIVWANFYTSFIRYPLHLRRGGTRENFRWVSGIPLVGVLLLCLAILCLANHPALVRTAIVIALLDTSGPHWLIGMLIYTLLFRPRT